MIGKDIKVNLGDTKFIRFRVPLYFTSHSKPERLRRYLDKKEKKK